MEVTMKEPKILGDYTLIKQIGQGSLGMVYLAEHRFMNKQFVVKILPEELSSDRSFIQRMEEDISSLASLDHPHIVKIRNISFSQGQYFIVMDCIVDDFGETTNLGQYLLSTSYEFDEDNVCRFLEQVATALDYAHSKKMGNRPLIHRGLKLSNILVGKGEKGAVELYLSDFGLSRIIGVGAVLMKSMKNVAEALGISSQYFLTKNGQEKYPNPPIDQKKLIPLHSSFLQNYAFIAPEQKLMDSSHPLDGKTDAYAFGVLAYYLLMREFPEGIFEMPSARKAEFQWDWDPLITQCMQKDPQKRPENLYEALQAIYKPIAQLTEEESLPQIDVSTPSNEAYIESFSEGKGISQRVIGQTDAGSVALKPIIHVTQIERPQSDPDPASIFQIDTTVKHYQPERKEVKNIQPILTDMVVIQGGNFHRGSNDGNRDEMPRHLVTVSSFAIDVHPVTNEQFVRFLEAMGGEKDSNHQDIIRMRDSRIKRSGGKISIESGYTKHPVVGVTWYGAIAYAKWIGKRLPTEAEWEIAARGGLESSFYPTGDDIEKTQANFFSSDTTSVMSYAPNGYGLYDIPGNVYEWCHDWYGYNYYEVSIQEPEDPIGPLQGVYRVLRGGCWKSLKEDLRCSRRHKNNPGTVNGTYGFRCAADVR